MRLEAFVVTCNRDPPTVVSTLSSLEAAGFRSPTVICEPDTDVTAIAGRDLWIIRSLAFQGPWGALRRALQIGLDLQADWILQAQDDIALARGTKGWLIDQIASGVLDGCGAASLYCNSAHSDEALAAGITGWITVPDKDLPRRAYGGCCLIFSAESAKLLLANPPNPSQKLRADLNVGTFCKLTGRKFLIHCPSLCIHCGTVSVAHPTAEINYLRSAKHFVRDVGEISNTWTCEKTPQDSTPI
jgi:hypothetical protein